MEYHYIVMAGLYHNGLSLYSNGWPYILIINLCTLMDYPYKLMDDLYILLTGPYILLIDSYIIWIALINILILIALIY